MRSGTLRERVKIQSVATQRVGSDTAKTWSDVATVWASVESSGRETERQKQIHKEMTHRVVMRYRDIDTKSRLVWRERNLEILASESDAKRTQLILACVERV